MSSSEPSYYEIALTHRQVVLAFAVLLVCLFAAFFSGVWLGRGSLEPSQAQAGEVVAQTGEAATEEVADPAPQKREDGLEEMRFFSENQGGDAGPGPSTTLREDLAAKPADRSRGAQPAASPPPSTATSSPPPPVVPPPVATPPPSRVAPPPSLPPAIEGEGFVVQVLSTANPSQAQNIQEKLIEMGLRAFLSTVDVEGVTHYRVRTGPFATREEAEKVARRVHFQLELETWITR